MTYESEAELMRALADNSVDAFNRIYELYIRRLRAHVSNMVQDPDDVEDILQETFVNLWRYHERIDSDMSLSTLLFTIAHRQTLNSLRRSRISAAVLNGGVKPYATIDYNNSTLEYREFEAATQRAIGRLPAKQKEVMQLLILDKDISQIAETMQLSVKTIRNLLSIARKHLRPVINGNL